jgi:hypothetical protein
MLNERYEVSLNFLEVYLPSAASFKEVRLQVKVSEKLLELVHNSKPQGQVILYGLNPSTTFEFVLYADQTLVGSCAVPTSVLSPNGVVGSGETWVRIETDAIGMDSSPSKTPVFMRSLSELSSNSQSAAKRYARVRLSVTSRNTANKSRAAPLKMKDITQCPFLTNIASAPHEDVEAFDTYRRVKDEVMRELHDTDRPLVSQVSVKATDLPGDYFTMDIPNLDGLDFSNLNPGEGEVLRSMITGLSQHINVLRADHEELGLLREQIDKSSRALGELEDSIQETTHTMQRESMRAVGTLKLLEDELSKSRNKAAAQRQQITEFKDANDQLQRQKTELAREAIQLRAQTANSSHLETQIGSLKQLQTDLEQKGLDLHGSKEQEAREFAQLATSSAAERSQLIEEKERLLRALSLQSNEVDHLKVEVNCKEAELQAVSLQAKESAEAKKAHDTLIAAKSQSNEILAKFQTLLEGFARTEAQIAAESMEFQDQLVADKQNIAEHLDLVESELESAQKRVNESKRQLLEKKSQIGVLEEMVRADYGKEELQQELELHRATKDEALREVQSLSDYILAQAQKGKDHVQLIYKLSAAVEERNEVVDQLKHVVVMTNSSNPMYVPVRGDSVDETLAAYLNSRTEPIPVPFYREDFEIYIFGTKRIFVKLDCGRIAIRVGGGFMQLEDFLEIYTKQELDKIDARNSRSSPGKTKKLIGKIAEAHLGEKSMSPLRAAKILSQQSFTTCFGVKGSSL